MKVRKELKDSGWSIFYPLAKENSSLGNCWLREI
jgi:hypothetical protein